MRYPINNPSRKRERVFNKSEGKCSYCNIDLVYNPNPNNLNRDNEFHMDHIIPRSQGGTSVGDENYTASCCKCNNEKRTKGPEEFLDHCLQKSEKIIQEAQRLGKIISNLKTNFIHE